jgi:hypothetical protein
MQESGPLPEPVADVDETEHVVGVTFKADAFVGFFALIAQFIFFPIVAWKMIFASLQSFQAATTVTRISTDVLFADQKPVQFVIDMASPQWTMREN